MILEFARWPRPTRTGGSDTREAIGQRACVPCDPLLCDALEARSLRERLHALRRHVGCAPASLEVIKDSPTKQPASSAHSSQPPHESIVAIVGTHVRMMDEGD